MPAHIGKKHKHMLLTNSHSKYTVRHLPLFMRYIVVRKGEIRPSFMKQFIGVKLPMSQETFLELHHFLNKRIGRKLGQHKIISQLIKREMVILSIMKCQGLIALDNVIKLDPRISREYGYMCLLGPIVYHRLPTTSFSYFFGQERWKKKKDN